jgi:hypothetical protein
LQQQNRFITHAECAVQDRFDRRVDRFNDAEANSAIGIGGRFAAWYLLVSSPVSASRYRPGTYPICFGTRITAPYRTGFVVYLSCEDCGTMWRAEDTGRKAY